jgi:uncharacterized protein YndB with AHSA1/START domain
MVSNTHEPVARVSMLVRRPVAEVFNAFVEPALLERFWLSKASGPLQTGKSVRWDFMVEGASADAYVKELSTNERIFIEWSDGTTVSFKFTPHRADATVVGIENAGFNGDADEVIQTAIESTQGFTIVLCDLKTLLEQGRSMNLVRDKAALIEATMAAEG